MNWKKWFYTNKDRDFPDGMPISERYNEGWMFKREDEGPPTRELTPFEWEQVIGWLKAIYNAIKWKDDK